MSHLAWYFFANAYASLGKFGHLRVRSLVWEARAFVLVRVKWGNTISERFSVMHGIKRGGVQSPSLFAVYTDGLLERLANTGVGCHMGSD